jgi:SAM-dependent methyltransferase
MYNPAAMDARYLRRLPPYVYLQDLWRGRRVLELGCGDGDAAHYLLQAGARAVTGVDRSARAVDAARARFRAANLEFRTCDYASLELEDRSFDVVCVPAGADAARQARVLEECRRVLTREGALVLCAPSADRAEGRGGVSFHELGDRLGALFSRVRMAGITPFVGFSLVEYGDDSGEVLEIDLDTQLAGIDGADDAVTDYLAIAGAVEGPARGYTVVQLPVAGGLHAAAAARAGSESAGLADLPGEMGERLRNAEAAATDAVARLREAEAELTALRRQAGRGESDELKRRLARAVEERAAAEAEVGALRVRINEADVEIGRVAAQAALEIGELRAEAATAATRIGELEAQLAAARREAEAAGGFDSEVTSVRAAGTTLVQAAAEVDRLRAEVARLGAERDAAVSAARGERDERERLAARCLDLEGRLAAGGGAAEAPASPMVSIELLQEAALRHEQTLAEVRAELDERDAYIEELGGELAAAERRGDAAQAAAREANARARGLEAELREVRGRMARAEGEALRLRLGAAEAAGAGAAAPAVPVAAAVPVAPASPAAPDPGVVARIAELEKALVERGEHAEKMTARWKAAEAKSDELWRKVGEMQRELEQNRESAVENARAQRQAAQIALARAVEEASKKLVSCQDQLTRTEKERRTLEAQVKELKERPAPAPVVAEPMLPAEAEERVAEIERIADAKVAAARAKIELLEANAARKKLAEQALLARVEELEEQLAALGRGLREEEQRLGELEENLRVVHTHVGLVPDTAELERELVAQAAREKQHAADIASREEKLAALAAELGQRDAELVLLHARVAAAEKQVGDVISAVKRASAELGGKSSVEIAAMLDRLAAEATESSRA